MVIASLAKNRRSQHITILATRRKSIYLHELDLRSLLMTADYYICLTKISLLVNIIYVHYFKILFSSFYD